MAKKLYLFLLLIICSCAGIDQILAPANEPQDPDKPNISLEDDEVPEEADTIPDAELNIKRNVFYGEKTKKAFTSFRNRDTEDYRLFHVLKEPVQVDNYVRDIFYHDTENNVIARTQGKGQTLERVLHGPYERLVNDITVEKGNFYYGMKHETWLYQRMDSTLYEKEHYNKGWLRDAEITYYDEDAKTKIKEVIPYQYGKKEGIYYRFFENGSLAVTGEYFYGYKVGVWTEYFDADGIVIRKREVQYPRQFYDWDFEPYVRREWNRNGQTVYSASRSTQ